MLTPRCWFCLKFAFIEGGISTRRWCLHSQRGGSDIENYWPTTHDTKIHIYSNISLTLQQNILKLFLTNLFLQFTQFGSILIISQPNVWRRWASERGAEWLNRQWRHKRENVSETYICCFHFSLFIQPPNPHLAPNPFNPPTRAQLEWFCWPNDCQIKIFVMITIFS